jgi:hypothetical protein
MFPLTDPFAPDEMAQHRTPAHCPTCLERKPCVCDGEADALDRRAETQATLPEVSPPDPQLSAPAPSASDESESAVPERWEERRDLE